ncbi:hypothetical protein [Histidinibacterium aquaticum]|uniref:Uncharacterized protein n=1 Tax=Histidinibacterium aquaticum TaxID=2613962 RepID=A0A5J5GN45_9RHOB|nr:hypothetical protein [Histidinibacterium aquaticum]KAA9009699.1 hypothetical protein F3S47_00025 [Histidinibacterium aquaticum]
MSLEARDFLSVFRDLRGHHAKPTELTECSVVTPVELHGAARELTNADLLRIEWRNAPNTGQPGPFRWHLISKEITRS